MKREDDLRTPGLFDEDERRQLEDDKRHWTKRLGALECELESEPADRSDRLTPAVP